MDILYIVIGLVLLILGGDWLLKGAVNLASKLQISKVIIGMTIVSFATSAPELIVSIKSAINGYQDLALGNVIGSNIANLALVLGVTLCLTSISVTKSFYTLDWPIMMLASVLLFVFIKFDFTLSRIEGMILFLILIVFIIYLIQQNRKNKSNMDLDLEETENSYLKIFFFLILGGVGLWGGSELLINGAVGLATELGISERIIGITILSVGTSIPELAASIIAIVKKEKGISLGNLIGSNIFNILAVLGITSMITPIKVSDLGLITSDVYWMLGIAFVIMPLCLLPKRNAFGIKEGLFLISTYALFVYFTL